MDTRPIGVFDSGLGGLSVVRQLMAQLPAENILYFGDTGRVPYGTRGTQVIQKYAAQDCRFLMKHDVKLIIAACGTVSSVAAEVLKQLPLPALGVVEPASKAAATATRNGRIGVIGTAATVRTDAYRRCLLSLLPEVQVVTQACPLFVPLVEAGWIDADDDVALPMARRYLQPLAEQGIDTLILGCTHFPLLAPIISRVLGDGVTLIDAGREAAVACASLLQANDALNLTKKVGDRTFYVTDRPDGFIQVADRFLGCRVDGDIHTVDIDLL